MNQKIRKRLAIGAGFAAIIGAALFLAVAPTDRISAEGGQPDVVYWPTPQVVVDKMLETARVTKNDLIYDLGCGDARSVVTAAKTYGAHGIGFDVNPVRINEARENVRRNNVGNLVEIRQTDIFQLDLSPANVVYLYLLPSLNVKLMPQLSRLRPGSRIVSHDFDMRGAKPKRVVTVRGPRDGAPDRIRDQNEGEVEHTIYLWEVPWEREN